MSTSTSTSTSTSKATFAAGCFWSVELVYQREPGVLNTTVGYTGGETEAPTYEQVCTGQTGHAEAVEVEYDAEQVSYGRLLQIFWNKHDPTTRNRQGADVGSQYRSEIFYHDDAQREAAAAGIAEQERERGKPVATLLEPAGRFWPAEHYHQRYLEKGGQCANKGSTEAISCYGR